MMNFSWKITMLAQRAPCQSLKHMLMLILLENLEMVNGTSENSRESGSPTMVKRPTVHLRGMIISTKSTKMTTLKLVKGVDVRIIVLMNAVCPTTSWNYT